MSKIGRWVQVEKGRRWQYRSGKEILGFVNVTFGAWDGYIITGKKWGDQKRVTPPRLLFDPENPFYRARRFVEIAAEDSAAPKEPPCKS